MPRARGRARALPRGGACPQEPPRCQPRRASLAPSVSATCRRLLCMLREQQSGGSYAPARVPVPLPPGAPPNPNPHTPTGHTPCRSFPRHGGGDGEAPRPRQQRQPAGHAVCQGRCRAGRWPSGSGLRHLPRRINAAGLRLPAHPQAQQATSRVVPCSLFCSFPPCPSPFFGTLYFIRAPPGTQNSTSQSTHPHQDCLPARPLHPFSLCVLPIWPSQPCSYQCNRRAEKNIARSAVHICLHGCLPSPAAPLAAALPTAAAAATRQGACACSCSALLT